VALENLIRAWCLTCWLRDGEWLGRIGGVIFSLVYVLLRRVLELLLVLIRWDLSKEAELLVLRHENAVLRRHVSHVRYQPVDWLWLATLSRLLTRHRWAEIFAVTPATVRWHRELAAR
jgi:putative transposase